MILISHRGNVEGKNPKLENNPDYILSALSKGYDCEADVWFVNDQFYLCHDYNLDFKYKINISFLKKKKIWFHAKNIEAMLELQKYKCFYFWHETDQIALTSNGYLWTFPGKKLTKKSICVLPEITNTTDFYCAGICSDVIYKYKDL
jgi:hypothetical protein